MEIKLKMTILEACEGLIEIMDCECDNTHARYNTVCRWCCAVKVIGEVRKEIENGQLSQANGSS